MASAYTFVQKSSPTSATGDDNFGGAVVDSNHQPLIGMGAGIQTSDITTVPVTSPIPAVTTGTTLLIPLNAIEITIISSSALRVSETSGTTGYFVIPAATAFTFGTARMGSIFLKQDSTSCVVSFYFAVI